MDSKPLEFDPGSVNFDVGNDGYGLPESSPDFREDRGAQKLAADALIAMLPDTYKQRIFAITKARGMCRSSRRAAKKLVDQGIRAHHRLTRKLQAKKDDRENSELSLYLRIVKRIARGVDKPFPGMTVERYEALKKLYGRVDSITINGETMQDMQGAMVRMTEDGVKLVQR